MSKKFGRNQKRKLKSEISYLDDKLNFVNQKLQRAELGARDLHNQYKRRWNSLHSITEEIARLVNVKPEGETIMLFANEETFKMFRDELNRFGLVTKANTGRIMCGKTIYFKIHTGPSFDVLLKGIRWSRAITTIGTGFMINQYVRSAVLAHLREDQTIREVLV